MIRKTRSVAAPTRAPARTSSLDAPELLRAAAAICAATKGEDIVALDLRSLSSVCDYFLIVSGNSEQHVRALARSIEDGLDQRGAKLWHREGSEGRRWVLLDYVDVVIHLFHRETRVFYRLESLWADAERVPLDLRATEPDPS